MLQVLPREEKKWMEQNWEQKGLGWSEVKEGINANHTLEWSEWTKGSPRDEKMGEGKEKGRNL